MKTMLLVLGMITTTLGAAIAPAGISRAGDASPFEFQLQQTESHRGLGVHGYVHNPLPWRITNVRLQVDSVDANGTLIASASGWVQGDVGARGRGYFYVPIAAPAPTYRASVQAFDKVIFEAPQAP
jgi:hypothetical protein